MHIEKLPSGSYRATVMEKGKRYRKTFDHKPTQKEILQALSEEMEENSQKIGITFAEAAKRYIDMKRNVLSPNTVREYSSTCTRLSSWFTEMKIDDITQIEINKQINELSKCKNPKTVRNYHGFISAILGTFKPNMKIYTTLPQKRKIEPYIPSDKDIKAILKEVEETEFYIPIILACYGMRRGEICALEISDIDGDVVHINKSMAYDENKKWVVKSTKTTESERDIIIPSNIAALIKNQGYVYKGHPNSITCKMAKIEDKLELPHFSIHKLRHYFASKMLTITDSKTVQKLGGWQTDNVMKTIYAHSLKEEQEKAKRKAVDTFNESLFN